MNFVKNLLEDNSILPLDVNCKITCTCKGCADFELVREINAGNYSKFPTINGTQTS